MFVYVWVTVLVFSMTGIPVHRTRVTILGTSGRIPKEEQIQKKAVD
jgi:hypothetical protein